MHKIAGGHLHLRTQTLSALALITALSVSTAQDSHGESISDIFFLDLGIVIEPADGSETYSRVVASTSDEVKFRVKKIESGSVYMASSKEMMTTLDRIQEKVSSLDHSIKNDISFLKKENSELKTLIADLKTSYLNSASDRRDVSIPASAPVIKEHPKEGFNTSVYMSGVFAYQREDYSAALKRFSSLDLDLAQPRTAENILYWMADSYLQKGEYAKALSILDQLLLLPELNREADALIQKGLVYRKLGRESEALNAFSEILARHPKSEYAKLAGLELAKAEVIK
ncbi:MAG: tetratricopeptide repeat protein [Candidatus Marinimicrobia bacterium]|jgi:TolA-binding protein|nr:tetratricopeptide repeat protein [Candidatus Neomarinimicrobiota bacterium]MDP6790179.1 tetratricopeptide repeat protein [Candidatus Neomarinimicrobiota bacterium]MDP7072502.1 tetratricopeptide repeat protein [Candidatus Neomarinimicrobiota bacterium]